MKKKMLSLLLALVMVIGSMAGSLCIRVEASTNGHTQAEAVAWANKQEGSAYSGDFGYQCVDLVRAYYDYLGQPMPYGDANTYLKDENGHKPDGWTINEGSSGLQPGDITVWDGGKYGHVAIVVETYNSSCKVIQQNGDGTVDGWDETSKGSFGTQYYSNITGYIHPDFPDAPNLGNDFYAVILNTDCWKPISESENSDKIILDTEKGIARQKWHFVRQDNGAYIITSCYDGKALEMTDGIRTVGTQLTAHTEWGGAYQQWYLIKQGNGYVFQSKHYYDENWVMDSYGANTNDGNKIQINKRNNSPAQIWSIYKADDVQLKAASLSVNLNGSTATFTWNKIYGAKYYDLKIWKNQVWEGDSYHTEWSAQSGFSIDLPAGKYMAYVDSCDYYECIPSNIVSFTVSTPSASTFTVCGYVEGENTSNIDGYGTFDVYLDGQCVANDVTRFIKSNCAPGTTYSISDIRCEDGKAYGGCEGMRTGTINSNTVVRLKFVTVPESVGVTTQTRTWNGHTYIYVPRNSSWYAAKTFSEKLGGYLVTLNSAEEEAFIREFTGNCALWIGATDRENENNWRWVTGESFSYSNFASGQPDNASANDEGCENYVLLQQGANSGWNDIAGYNVNHFVCEISPVNPTVNVTGVSLNEPPLTLNVGESKTLTATVTPSNASNKAVTWSSDKTSVATVDASGKVTAKAPGTAKITVKTVDGGYTASCTVTVTEPTNPDEPTLSVASPTAMPGGTVRVPITLANNPGLSSLKITITYDRSVMTLNAASAISEEFASVKNAVTVVNWNPYGSEDPAEMDLTVYPLVANWMVDPGQSTKNGVFLELVFDIKADALEGSYSISVTYDEDDVFGGSGTPVNLAVNNGVVKIIDHVPGDMNGDGKVNNRDAMALFRYVSGLKQFVTVPEEFTDVNGDGKSNNRDAMMLFRYVSGIPQELH